MNSAVIQLIILGIVIVFFALDKFPLALVAMLGMLATFFSGAAPFADAFGGFANNSVFMMIGMYIIGNTFMETGLISKFADTMIKLLTKDGKKLTNKSFNIIGGILTAGFSTVINTQLVVTVFHNIIDALSLKSADFKRKYSYLPISLAGGPGVTITSISAATVILSSGLLEQSSFGRGFTFFEPAYVGLPALIVTLIYMATIGDVILRKTADFEDVPPPAVSGSEENAGADAAPKNSNKMYLTAIIFLITLGFMIFSEFPIGSLAMACAGILMVTGCIEPMKAIRTVPWHSIVLVGSLLGIAKGMQVSGAGELAANFLIDLAGPILQTPFGFILMAFFIPNIIGMFMNNSAAAAISVPIFLIIGEQLGIPLLPVALASGAGCNLKTTTPTATHIAISIGAGYRFRDYVAVGGILNILTILVCTVVLVVFLF